MTDYLQQIRATAPLREAAIRQAIAHLGIPAGAVVLDIGSGDGHHALLLAAEAGRDGTVTGVDVAREHVEAARALVATHGMQGRVHFVQGSFEHLPFPDSTADLIWCADTLWPLPGAPAPATVVRELVRVLRPGGRLALVYFSGQALLPGYPVLEATLQHALSKATPYLAGVAPEDQAFRAPKWMREAGLVDRTATTFVSGVSAPLSGEMRASLAAWIEMLWGGATVSEEDRGLLGKLTAPGSSGCLLDDPDYYGFITYTMFVGRRV